jgi:hypothetical protein
MSIMEDAISKLVENRANTRGKEKESPEGGKEKEKGKEKGKEEKKEPRGSVLNEAGELVIRLVLPDRGEKEKEGDIPKRKKKLIKPSLSGLINKLTKK